MSLDDVVMRKIKRCMELSESSNQSEAAIALKQMQALMKKHGITSDQVEMSDIVEACNDLDIKSRVPSWILNLHTTISAALDCKSMVERGIGYKSTLKFIGVDPAPTIAAYAFEVLYKQIKTQRKHVIEGLDKRLKPASKTKIADAFCKGFVIGMYDKCANLNPDKKLDEKLKRYTDAKAENPDKVYGGADSTKHSRHAPEVVGAMVDGARAGSEVNLHAATEYKSQTLIENKDQ